jgi:hypothetical protein
MKQLHSLSFNEGERASQETIFRHFYLMTDKLRDLSDGQPLSAPDCWVSYVSRLVCHLAMMATQGNWKPERANNMNIYAWKADVLPLRIAPNNRLREAMEHGLEPFSFPKAQTPPISAQQTQSGARSIPPKDGKSSTNEDSAKIPMRDFDAMGARSFSQLLVSQLGEVSPNTRAIDWRAKNRELAHDLGKRYAQTVPADNDVDRGDREAWDAVKKDPANSIVREIASDAVEMKKQMQRATVGLNEMLKKDQQLDSQSVVLANQVLEQDSARAHFVDLRWRLLVGFVVASLLGTVSSTALLGSGVEEFYALSGGAAAGVVAIAVATASYFVERYAGQRGSSYLFQKFRSFKGEVLERINARRGLSDDAREVMRRMCEQSRIHATERLKSRLESSIRRTFANCMETLQELRQSSDETGESVVVEGDCVQQGKELKVSTLEAWGRFANLTDRDSKGLYPSGNVEQHIRSEFCRVLQVLVRTAINAEREKVSGAINEWTSKFRRGSESGEFPGLSVRTGLNSGRRPPVKYSIGLSQLVPETILEDPKQDEPQNYRVPACATRVAACAVYWLPVSWDEDSGWIEMNR